MAALLGYLSTIRVAVSFFPLVAFLFTLPYLIHGYRKYGSVPLMRSLVVYSFILYIICVYFLVILPLPDHVDDGAGIRIQAEPFRFVRLFLENSGFVYGDKSTWIPAIKTVNFYTTVLNVIMFFPLGVYLHYYFRRGFFLTGFIGFVGSLFCEFTQITGVYGMFTPYRLFDVDDLIVNTFGALLGWLLSPLITFILPSRERIDEDAYLIGRNVTLMRRMMAFLIDFLILRIPVVIINEKLLGGGTVSFVITDSIICILYFSLMSYLSHGRSIGRFILGTRLATLSNHRVKLCQCFVRYIILCGFTTHIYQFIKLTDGTPLVFVFRGFVLLIAAETVINFFTSKKLFLYDRISGTYNINTIYREPEF